MLAGTELIRRKLGKDAGAMTITLLLNSEGKKMGKTQSGAVWLDPEKTSPFEFYQYWRNVADADVLKCIRMLTFLPLEEIDKMDSWEGAKNGKRCSAPAPPHAQTEYAPDHDQERLPPQGPHSGAEPLQWFLHSATLPEYVSVLSCNDRRWAEETPVSFASAAGKPCSAVSGHGLSETQDGYHTEVPPLPVPLSHGSTQHNGLDFLSPFLQAAP